MNTLQLIVVVVAFIILGILMVIYGIIGDGIAKRKNILKRVGVQTFYRGALDEILDRIDFIVKREAKIDKKIAVLDVKIYSTDAYKTRTSWCIGRYPDFYTF